METLKRDKFYYIIISDIETNRDNRISEIFNEEISEYYVGKDNKKTDDISKSRFWKDNIAPKRLVEKLIKSNPLLKTNIVEIDREMFLKITEKTPNTDYVCLRTLRLRNNEIEYMQSHLDSNQK